MRRVSRGWEEFGRGVVAAGAPREVVELRGEVVDLRASLLLALLLAFAHLGGGERVVRSGVRGWARAAREGGAGARLRVQARRNLAAHALGLAQHGGDVRLPRVKIVLVLARVVGAEPLLHGARDGVEEGALPSQVAVAPQQPEALAAEEAARHALNQQRAARLVRERAPRDKPAPSGGHEDRRKRLGGPLGLRLVGEAEEGLLDVGEGVGAEGVVDGGAAAHGEERRAGAAKRSVVTRMSSYSDPRLGISARLTPLSPAKFSNFHTKTERGEGSARRGGPSPSRRREICSSEALRAT